MSDYENKVAELHTTAGQINIRFFPDVAPNHVKNFLDLAQKGFYDGTKFHRVIPGFMIQGGGFTADMTQKPTKANVQNEADNGLTNDRGTVAMARTSDPHSASAQFFINVKDNAFLNHKGKNPQGWGYAVFGKVVEGMDVADAMTQVKTGQKGPHGDVPVEPIVVKTATVVQ
ncbi:MAG TPA: peptidylprolyl isomerase [Thermoanaerobaculia bacterium]